MDDVDQVPEIDRQTLFAGQQLDLIALWIEPDNPYLGQSLEQLVERAMTRDLRVVGVEDHGAGPGGNDLLQGIATIGVDHVQVEPVLMRAQPSRHALGEECLSRKNHDARPIHNGPRAVA